MERRNKWLVTGLVLVGAISVIFFAKDRFGEKEPIQFVERNPPGMGETEVSLEVWTEAGSYPVEFVLEERKYSDDELETMFLKGKEWLDQVWLGENTSEDSVMSDLYFPAQVEDMGINIRWEPESYRWVQSDGTVTEEAYECSPLTMDIRAILSYGEIEKAYDYTITIRQENMGEGEAFKQQVLDVVQEEQTQGNTSETFVLPETIDGMDVVWYSRQAPLWPKILVFGSLIIILLYFNQEEKKMQKLKNRELELRYDYPEIVYRLVLLIGAGTTVKGAWEKILSDYQREKKAGGKSRWGYEEMEMTWREMNYGISELKAYENFGKRCGNQNYIRLSSLLIQQVKRGAKGMNLLLMQEVSEAEIIRRENARKNAEEAGTKLLLPMVLMMTVVFAVLMFPAFISMGI